MIPSPRVCQHKGCKSVSTRNPCLWTRPRNWPPQDGAPCLTDAMEAAFAAVWRAEERRALEKEQAAIASVRAAAEREDRKRVRRAIGAGVIGCAAIAALAWEAFG